MLIADEVHNLGSPATKKALIVNAGLRLGLSATPRRWFDEEGTQVLIDYFGCVCFEFGLEEAIGKYLTPYEYVPVPVHLTSAESAVYEDLTARISMLISAKQKPDEYDSVAEQLKKLQLERVRILGSAGNKLGSLLGIFREMLLTARKTGREVAHVLVYCAPGSHKGVLRALADLGLRCHEFVHSVPLAQRQKVLQDFASGLIQVIVAIKCLDEGVDVPSTQIAFMLASTSNPREFVQRRGRILRLAGGKETATIYDFIIVPRPEYVPLKREIDAGLLKREMPRFAEFASAASNEFQARNILWDLLDHYELLNLFDEKPWDMYYRIRQERQLTDAYL